MPRRRSLARVAGAFCSDKRDDEWRMSRRTTRRVQVANLPPADSGRGVARLPVKLMTETGPRRRRRDRNRRQALDRGPRHPPLWRRRRARHHPPRRPAARQCRRRIGRFRRSAQGDSRSRRRGSSSPRPQNNVRLQGSAEALKRSFDGRPFTRGRHGRHRRPPAGQCRHARTYPPAAQRARPSRCRKCG